MIENKLVDVNFIISEFRKHFNDEVEIYEFVTKENELTIDFKLKEGLYKYKLKKGSVIDRKLSDFNLNLEVLEELEIFIKQLIIKVFVNEDINQTSIYEYQEDRLGDAYGNK